MGPAQTGCAWCRRLSGLGSTGKVTRAGSWMGDRDTGASQCKVSPNVEAREPWQPQPWVVDLCNPRTEMITLETVGQSHPLICGAPRCSDVKGVKLALDGVGLFQIDEVSGWPTTMITMTSTRETPAPPRPSPCSAQLSARVALWWSRWQIGRQFRNKEMSLPSVFHFHHNTENSSTKGTQHLGNQFQKCWVIFRGVTTLCPSVLAIPGEYS